MLEIPTQFTRRSFSKSLLTCLAASMMPIKNELNLESKVIKPPRLKAGDTIGVVSPAGITYDPILIDVLTESLDVLGLKMKRGEHMQDRWGYFAGEDQDRAADINQMFADPAVDAIFALHGGWGAARTLDHIDYNLIRNNPKVILGYSDITALLVAIYSRSGIATFHGPNGNSKWNTFSAEYVRRLLFDADQISYANPVDEDDLLAPRRFRTRTIQSGKATGKLVGGNLTVLTSIIGSDYLPDWKGHVLFLEDIGEAVYRVDRMLTQLKLAGVLDNLSGFVFGYCTDCKADSGYSSFTLNEVLDQHIKPLGIPAWTGSMIGHIDKKFTLPLGIEAEINADTGEIKLLEAAVV